ncbi:methylated-DNA--protein-cysteine methyltransferase, inducible [Drosophila gunungcola]|uniref:methylated-DNA--protein-cysteine methyltransferase, inducible n=1 Tax=Drosophila gunungcola TaxID=103775 RepID=UPI0022E93A7A|nr:methylated-DNA--protein-cysteine methyltransferase, inducible [Drosophila gunungcola]
MWCPLNQQIRLIQIEAPPEAIHYNFLETKYGLIMMGVINPFRVDSKDQVALCSLHFVDKHVVRTYDEVRKRWPDSMLEKNDSSVQLMAEKLFGGDKENLEVIPIVTRGTKFQQTVWSALLDLKSGETCTYKQLADRIGRPTAVRAVANAVAKNDIAFLIPCHRIVSQNGASKYHWGTALKQQLLDAEKNSNY